MNHPPLYAAVKGVNPLQRLSTKCDKTLDIIAVPLRKTEQAIIEPGNSFFESFAFSAILPADPADNQKRQYKGPCKYQEHDS
ncbi:MAG: hypothetical protein P8Z73_04445 [Desulfobacteraceae bacterium]